MKLRQSKSRKLPACAFAGRGQCYNGSVHGRHWWLNDTEVTDIRIRPTMVENFVQPRISAVAVVISFGLSALPKCHLQSSELGSTELITPSGRTVTAWVAVASVRPKR